MGSITRICKKCGAEKPMVDFPPQRRKCKACAYVDYKEKYNREFRCKNCGRLFLSPKLGASRMPRFCSRACAGFKKGCTPANKGKGGLRYEKCELCGKPKVGKRERMFRICHTCKNKSRARNVVYYACPRCGKPKNGRGRSDRVFCNSCASIYRHLKLGHIIKPYYIGFTNQIKDVIRAKYHYLCAICGKADDKTLAVHHVDYDKNNQSESNLLPLCSSCHGKTNYRREYWRGVCLAIIAYESG